MNRKTFYAVLTAHCPDRVGIVDDITALLVKDGCNVEKSHMAVLGGEFVVIMLVSGPEPALDKLRENLSVHSENLGLTISMRPTRPPENAGGGVPYRIETTCLDTPGIVHSVTALLREYGVNIEELDTATSRAPWTGSPMFHMTLSVTAPEKVSLAKLQDTLRELAAERDLDISIQPVR